MEPLVHFSMPAPFFRSFNDPGYADTVKYGPMQSSITQRVHWGSHGASISVLDLNTAESEAALGTVALNRLPGVLSRTFHWGTLLQIILPSTIVQ